MVTEYNLHPRGWETCPEEERFKVSTLDYLTGLCYTHFAVYFRLNDADRNHVTSVLKEGLECTLGQIGHLCGTIERAIDGSHWFVKRKHSTVRFIVQVLDTNDDGNGFPSMDDLEKSNFAGRALGDFKNWKIEPFTYGEKPEAHPDSSPVASAFMANFVRGGLVLITHMHHYANDAMGWSGFIHQLAENCYAINNGTAMPSWNPICNDVSVVCKPNPSPDQLVDGPPPPELHPDHMPGISLLFHLPKSKAAELKRLAEPQNGTWISTFDAFTAFTWRTMTRLRQPVFQIPLDAPIYWAAGIDMRRRMKNPPVHPRTQHNILSAGVSDQVSFPQLTHAEVISEKPLWELAAYIRKLTSSQTQETVDAALTAVSYIKDKTSLNIRINSKPPMSILTTDHRKANVTDASFGFARPLSQRHLQQGTGITVGVHVVYPPKFDSNPESDEGNMFAFFYEKELAEDLINDKEFAKFFEYRGVDNE
ncbi:hypothetical protein BDV59DRAFT_209994 [Aspergillus ambiguus]|uniref:uncharacterized protein n=1 Tax=Aspergillus ambiguus TaxID=176160 RepID=UPI003CCE29A1